MVCTVDILLFDDVEVLDFAGPFEVFGVAGARPGPPAFQVRTVALNPGPVIARNGLSVNPTHAVGADPIAPARPRPTLPIASRSMPSWSASDRG
jgi:transcriptional regulator GlxA family with amidase domain